jgi:hypothetical protein
MFFRMSIGKAVRSALGPVAPLAAGAYRRVFVDVRKVAACVPPIDGLLLDVGGGDGAILNSLLDLQPALRVTAVDIAPAIGQLIRKDLRARVDLRPATSVRQYIEQRGESPRAVLVSDVMHHVRPIDRVGLVRDLLDSFGDNRPVLIVKDIVPQGFRSAFAFWADRNISGDKAVSAISPTELVDLVRSVRPDLTVESTPLLDIDYPNYLVVLRG